MTDAFQAAAAAHTQATAPKTNPQTDAVNIPAGALADMNDPFATSSQIQTGGAFTPRVPFEDIAGRLVVMIARSYDPAANDPFNEGEKREEFRVDLVILDGGAFEYEYSERNPGDPTQKVYKTAKVETLPFAALSQSIAQGGLIGKLKGVLELGQDAPKTHFTTVGRLFMGVMSYAPYRRDEKKGATIDSTTKTVEEWIARGRKTTKPDYTWALDDRAHVLTPERRAVAGAWWSDFRKTL
jgi:hypothetical protein